MFSKTGFAVLLCFCLAAQYGVAQDVSAIMGAMPEEISVLKERMQNLREVRVEGLPFWEGRLQNRNVVLVQSGVGKVNAALTTTLLLQHFKPAHVLFTGVAGGIGDALQIGDIIVADSVVQHDLGTLNNDDSLSRWGAKNPLNNLRNPVFFKPDSLLRSLALSSGLPLSPPPIGPGQNERAPVLRHGVIATGDQFVSSAQKKAELKASLHAQAVEMEGAAVAQVCYQQQVPFLIIRSISDLANEEARISFDAFMKTAAKNAATVVTNILRLLPESRAVQSNVYMKTELYFGMESGGRYLTEKQWQDFLARQITPRFPEGFTVLNSYGQWLNNKTKKLTREPSRVVVILHKNDAAAEKALKTICDAYRKQFRQEAVLRIDTKTSQVSF